MVYDWCYWIDNQEGGFIHDYVGCFLYGLKMVECTYFNRYYLEDCGAEAICDLYDSRFPLLFDEDNPTYYDKRQCEDYISHKLIYKYMGYYFVYPAIRDLPEYYASYC